MRQDAMHPARRTLTDDYTDAWEQREVVGGAVTDAHVEPGVCQHGTESRGGGCIQGRAGRVRRRRKSNARGRRRAAQGQGGGGWRLVLEERTSALIPTARDRAVREKATGNRTRGSAGRREFQRPSGAGRASHAGRSAWLRPRLVLLGLVVSVGTHTGAVWPAVADTVSSQPKVIDKRATPPRARPRGMGLCREISPARESRQPCGRAVCSVAVSQRLALLQHPWLATLVLGLSCRSMLHNLAKGLSRGCFNVFPAALHRGLSPGTSWSRAWIPKALSLISICLVAGPGERVSRQAPLTSAAFI
ncbi:uncharacterized protein CC84DRAFT_1245481 [Paraphaeosphaeria sporulosa]|uniref:Uncharacterized protein n=1 Tax=Paraphaeosphaeria sporulosa TaxID=1460663 RepID=A0A177CHP0_9PLEO|nr:uncharacterized protein CC84DRAFT_1245481 [Paraphaeosphaeria sporulosa]OAG06287.1 hypothetical protein CC84DRAFT_1245481 [Paraphaeosphaeria sporulosa]